MKAKTLLLAGLSALALASCGMKKYENEVSADKFKEKLLDAISATKMVKFEDEEEKSFKFECPDEPYSFEFKKESEGKSVDTYYKNDKKLSKVTTEDKDEYTIKFDASKSIYKFEEEGKQSYESESLKTTEEVDASLVYQCNTTSLFEINVNEKTYTKVELENPADFVAADAFKKPCDILEGFSNNILVGDKFYIDENVFTIEEISDEEDESKTKAGKTVYQLIVEEDEIKYFEETSLEIKEVNLKTVTKDSLEWSFEKKDVSLKQVDLEKYLKVTF